eukprot:2093451-Amphidinium_carterae.1
MTVRGLFYSHQLQGHSVAESLTLAQRQSFDSREDPHSFFGTIATQLDEATYKEYTNASMATHQSRQELHRYFILNMSG